jgi:peroxiredoxin
VPKLKTLHEKFKDRGLVVLGIHDSSENEKMEAFVKEKAIPFPCVADIEGVTLERFGGEGLPYAVLIDRRGIIHELAATDYEDTIPKLLEEKAP